MKTEKEPVLIDRQIIINEDDGDLWVSIADDTCVFWHSNVLRSHEEAVACVAGILAASFTPVGKRVEVNTILKK